MISSSSDDCFSNLNQDFLVCTTLHKARRLNTHTGDLYVRVTLNNERKSTKRVPGSESPIFNEYFVYEMRCTLNELLRLTILYELKKHHAVTKSIVLGELLIDLQSVWNQPNRCFFKKWGRLEVPLGGSEKEDSELGKGYIQIDLAIISRATNTSNLLRPIDSDLSIMNKWQLNQDYDDIEKNLLQDINTGDQCNIQYSICFCRAYLFKKGDYAIQYRFHPFKGRTNVAKNTIAPEWDEEITFAWTYPSLAQTFLVQLISHETLQWKVLTEYELHFDEIAFKALPALGPTFLHLYDPQFPDVYVGQLLIELRSERILSTPVRQLLSHEAPPINETQWWTLENFIAEFIAIQCEFFHGNYSNCKLTMKLGGHTSSNVECYLKPYSLNKYKITNLKYFCQEMPYKSISLKIAFPDNRNKFQSDFFMQELRDFIKNEIETFKLFQIKYSNRTQMHIKCLKALLMAVQSKINEGIAKKYLEYTGFKDPTAWDTNRLIFLQDFFKVYCQELNDLRLRLKKCDVRYVNDIIEEVLFDLTQHSNELSNLITWTRTQDEWPDLLLLMSISGNKDIAVCRLNAKHFLNMPRERDSIRISQCWRLRNFVFKDINCQHNCKNCGCIMAIVRGTLGILTENERADFLATISHEWSQPENFYWRPSQPYTNFKVRVFIHQAKVRPGLDRTVLCDPHVRVTFATHSEETVTEEATLSPIWNLVMTIQTISMPGFFQWYVQNPPLIAVELFDNEKYASEEYLGCGALPVSVVSSDVVDQYTREGEDSPRHFLKDINRFLKTSSVLQKFQQLKTLTPPLLQWLPVSVNGVVRAEILMAAEMIEQRGEISTNYTAEPVKTYGIPMGIKPNMKNFVLEVVFAGFRNYTKGATDMRHRIKILMGDLMLSSGLSKSRVRNSINFLILYASGVVSLPEQLEYWPSIIATDVAVTAKDKETIIGAVLIPNSRRYLQQSKQNKYLSTDADTNQNYPTVIEMQESDDDESTPLIQGEQKENIFRRLFNTVQPCAWYWGQPLLDDEDNVNIGDEKDFTWWTKFYNSIYDDAGDRLHSFKHKLVIYPNELEKQAEFSYLHDWAEPVKMVHGVKYKKGALPTEEVYATLKLHFKISPCESTATDGGDGQMLRPLAAAMNPKYQAQIASLADMTPFVVRVYVVQGIQFRAHGKSEQSDSFVRVQLGSRSLTNRAHHVPNQSNPIFGKCFELEGVLPREHMLEVSVFDHNLFKDNIIGSTFIDLEDRWRTKHRARIGLANEYSRSGYNKWRDLQKPSEILSDICIQNNLRLPKFGVNYIEVDCMYFDDKTLIAKEEEFNERLSLTVLNSFEKLPSFGYKLIPEHVETRSLFRNDYPGVEQGKIQLWIELYEAHLNLPIPIDITPYPPQSYELRIIIHNCENIIYGDSNLFGTHKSDIFVKGWCHDIDKAQTTDIHYKSLNGEAQFNWRMVFQLKYSTIEDMMIIKRRVGELEEYETKQPPTVYLQIWDTNFSQPEDYLGALEINLSNFPVPFDTPKACSDQLFDGRWSFPYRGADGDGNTRKPCNLFRKKSVRGWFPMRSPIKKPTAQENFILEDEKMRVAKVADISAKIELELQILSEAEAVADPVGLGRSAPHALQAPDRPDLSFQPFQNPIKTFQVFIIPFVRTNIWYFLGSSVLIAMFVVAWFMELPNLLLTIWNSYY